MEFRFQRKRIDKIPEREILDELEKAAKHFGFREFGWRDFDKVAAISAQTVKRQLGGWNAGLAALRQRLEAKGVELLPRLNARRLYSDAELFNEMERVWQEVGQRPSQTEWDLSNPRISYRTYRYRFGGWTNACLKFIEYKMGGSILADDFILPSRDEQPPQADSGVAYRPDNSRNVSLALRLKVLSRDNFRCVFCGRSPATDVGTRLHIDHVYPFSLGGRTLLDNLQTLCADCNVGKSNKAVQSP